MKPILCKVVLLILLISTPLSASEIRKEPVKFTPGTTRTSLKGKFKGYQGVDYLLCAKAGETLTMNLKTKNSSTYFNVMPPDEDTAIFIGSTSGNHFEGKAPKDGTYTIRIYLMRNAARRNESTAYSLEVSVTGRSNRTAATATGKAYNRTLELQGIRFVVSCANEGSLNILHIVPTGLEKDNSPIVREINGTVTGAEVADLNVDGSPEVYVYVTSAGSGSYGSLVAYSANRRRSLSEIYLPPIAEDKVASKGYMGHDEFAVLEGVLGRRFPVYRDTDTNATPTGGMRQLQYKLFPGEASWILKSEKIIEY